MGDNEKVTSSHALSVCFVHQGQEDKDQVLLQADLETCNTLATFPKMLRKSVKITISARKIMAEVQASSLALVIAQTV